MLSWGVGVSFVTPCEYGWRLVGVFVCSVLMRCVTEASALLAGVLTIFCTVYDCGGCALARVQFILCAVTLVAGPLIILLCAM